MYDDVELYNKFRFRHHDILIIVNELQGDLEYPDNSASCSGIVDVCDRLFPEYKKIIIFQVVLFGCGYY